jgi:hypothetical protein
VPVNVYSAALCPPCLETPFSLRQAFCSPQPYSKPRLNGYFGFGLQAKEAVVAGASAGCAPRRLIARYWEILKLCTCTAAFEGLPSHNTERFPTIIPDSHSLRPIALVHSVYFKELSPVVHHSGRSTLPESLNFGSCILGLPLNTLA